MSVKSLNAAGLLTLTNGDTTDWYDMQAVAAAEFNLIVTGTVSIVLEGANDITVNTKGDVGPNDTFTSTASRTIFEPMPRFLRLRQASGSGSAVFSWGKAIDHNGGLAVVSKQGYGTGSPSSDLTPS